MRLSSLAFIGLLCVPAVASAAKDAGELIVAGDYAAAEPLLRHQLATNHRDANAHYNLAVVLKHTGRLDDAAASATSPPRSACSATLAGGDAALGVSAEPGRLAERVVAQHPQVPSGGAR